MKKRTVKIAAYLYLYIPIVIFLLGWLKPIIGIPLTGALTLGLYFVIKSIPQNNDAFKINKKLLIIIGIILLWVLLSGVGGICWQNTYDHMFRNAIFKDLVNNPWPVVNFDLLEPRNLCYYFGFWLPSALIAKIFGSIAVGYFFQTIWAFIGVTITFLLISEWLNKISYKTILMLIFFSGLDIVALFLFKLGKGETLVSILEQLSKAQHIELTLCYFNSSSNTTLLFWLYNQIIPFWVGFMLLFNEKNNKNLIFDYSLLILFAPFPCVALIPIIVYKIFKNNPISKNHLLKDFSLLIKNCLTIQNISGFLVMILVALFYLSNRSAGKMGIIPINIGSIIRLILFLILEFFVYFIFIYKNIKKDIIFWLLLGTTIFLGFIKLGGGFDFAWRTCIPLTFYLMLLLLKNMDKINKKYKQLFIIILMIGSVTPCLEMLRTIETIDYIIKSKSNISFISDDLDSVFSPNICYNNFIGSENTIFNKYLRK